MSVIPRRKRRKPEINIVPLVDVLVVLIFFFLVSMQFRNLNLLDLVLPKVETAGQGDKVEAIEVVVTEEGDFKINGEAVTEEQLEAELLELARQRPSAQVLLLADENSRLQLVTRAMDLSRKAGLERIRLLSR